MSSRLSPLVTAGSLFLAATFAASSQAGTVDRFYKDKKKALSRQAYSRVEQRLARVEVGMREMALLETIEMKILSHEGKPVDALVDGYLPKASNQANRDEPGKRHLVFGYKEQDREQPRKIVVLEGRRVTAVRDVSTNLIAGLTPPHSRSSADGRDCEPTSAPR